MSFKQKRSKLNDENIIRRLFDDLAYDLCLLNEFDDTDENENYAPNEPNNSSTSMYKKTLNIEILNMFENSNGIVVAKWRDKG